MSREGQPEIYCGESKLRFVSLLQWEQGDNEPFRAYQLYYLPIDKRGNEQIEWTLDQRGNVLGMTDLIFIHGKPW